MAAKSRFSMVTFFWNSVLREQLISSKLNPGRPTLGKHERTNLAKASKCFRVASNDFLSAIFNHSSRGKI